MTDVIQFPWIYVPDPTKGRPLFNGSLYFGIPDLDPEISANQKLVYAIQEDGTEVIISQPVPTNSGGVPTYNGSPIRLGINGSFSLKVLNNLGAQVYYASEVNPSSSSTGSGSFGEETVTLASAQIVVPFSIEATTAIFHVSSPAIDSRRLVKGVDYDALSATSITLYNSFPAGTLITAEGAISGIPAPQSGVSSGGQEIIAHRGFMDVTFQNTLLAISSAVEYGADSVEMDASISSDGVWYLFHDVTVDALTNGTGTFTSLTSAYLDTLEISQAVGTGYEGIGITRLDDVLDYLRNTGVKAYIEMKNLRTDSDATLFVQKLEAYGLERSVTIQDATITPLTIARAANGAIRTALTTADPDVNNAITNAGLAQVNEIFYEFNLLLANPTWPSVIEAAGYSLAAFTIDLKRSINRLAEIGVRRIITDRSAIV